MRGAPYYDAKEIILSQTVAPYLVPDSKPLQQLYHRFGDLRFICFLPQCHRPKQCVDMEHLLVFDLFLSLDAMHTIEAIWPVPKPVRDVWKAYAEKMLSTGENTHLSRTNYKLAHHMLCKFCIDCMENTWRFIVRMDMSNLELIGRFGREHMETEPIFGNRIIDKLIMPRLGVKDVMTLALLNKSYRIRVWLHLWRYGRGA